MTFASKRYYIAAFILILLLSTFPIPLATESTMSTSIQSLSYKQEIILPIETSDPAARHQPIDMRLHFDHSCWAQNETIHSVRVGYDAGSGLEEIESQIYDLSHTDESHIDACSLVFLVPSDANGQETYYVLYDDQQTDATDYEDHISIKDTHYFYEPISGQIMDFDYYRITQDDHIIYALCQKGELLGNGMSNAIIKLLPNSTEFTTTNAEQIASFYMSYSINPPGEHTGSQWATDIKKTILVDGNLMTRIQIQGISPRDDIKTDNIYTYYYCPDSEKQLHVNVNHEILKDITVTGTKEREGTYASLSTIKARSGTIQDMNLGNILPKIHIYTEDETIKTYDIPTDPNADPAEWLLGATDDQDLGSKAWFCIDDPTTGQAHALLFAKNNNILDGPNDGIQVKASVKQHVKLLGLEADSGDLYALRNAYEEGSHSTSLSKGTNIFFDVQYLALQTGGHEAVDQESEFYQQLSTIRPIQRGNVSEIESEESEERYQLTAYVHLAPSSPLGSLLSALTGRNVSYLSAELYKTNDLSSSGAVSRLKIGEIPDSFDNTSFKEKINLIRGIFDLKNSTLFKTIRFNDLEAGSYFIKIYRENPVFGNQRKYIGYGSVDLQGDTKTRIYCKQETMLSTKITDQRNNGVQGVSLQLTINDEIITQATTNEKGVASLSFPFYKRNKPVLMMYYQGFLISDQSITLKARHRFQPMQTSLTIDRYDFDITVVDALGLSPAVDVNPMLSSNEMANQKQLQPESNTGNNYYQFINLYPASYKLKMSYKSFILEETISLNKDSSMDIVFPAEFLIDCSIKDLKGNPINTGNIHLHRDGKTVTSSISNGKGKLVVPPGEYILNVKNEDGLIAQQTINSLGDKSIDIITNQPSFLHSIMPIMLIVVFAVLSIYLFWNKHYSRSIHFIIIGLLLLSLFLPWWSLHGETQTVTTTTTTMLYPAKIITLTTTTDIIGGEIASVPEEFTMIIETLIYIVLATATLIGVKLFIKNRYPKITKILTILTLVLLIVTAVLFYIAMSEVTKVGVGSFMDSNEVSITLPGEAKQVDVYCEWGAGLGWYLIIIGFIITLIWQFRSYLQKTIKNIQQKTHS